MTAQDGMLAGRNPDDLVRSERHELISAYLDGELPAAEARQVTHWLDENPGALQEVEHIRRTWDLLEHYEDEAVPEGFAQRIFAAVGIERSANKAGRVVQMAWYRRPQGLMAAAAVLVVCVGALFSFSNDSSLTSSISERSAVAVLDGVPEDLLLHLDQLADLDDDGIDSVIALGADPDANLGG